MRQRILSIGGMGFILVALAHFAGQLGAHPSDPAFVSVWRGMSDTHLSMGFGTSPTLVDVWNSLSWTAIVTFAAIGLATLALANRSLGNLVPSLMTLVTTTAGLLAGVNLYFHVGLPAGCFAAITVILIGARVAVPGAAHLHD